MFPGLYLRGKVFWFRYSSAGKQRFVSLDTTDLHEAIRSAQAVRDKPIVHGGLWANEVASYIKDVSASGKLSPGFARNRKGALIAESIRMGWDRPSALTKEAIQSWFDANRKQKCDSTALTYLTHVRSFLHWCNKSGTLRNNPCDGIDLRRAKYALRSNIATADQARKLIDTASGALRLALMFGFLCGLRRREIMNARQDWIEGKHLRIKEGHGFRPKWGRERLVPLPGELQANLRDASSPYLIGTGRAPYDFKKPWILHAEKQEITGLTIHDWRRTFGSLKATAGVPLFVIAKWMGISVAVAERNYAHLAPDTSGGGERGLP